MDASETDQEIPDLCAILIWTKLNEIYHSHQTFNYKNCANLLNRHLKAVQKSLFVSKFNRDWEFNASRLQNFLEIYMIMSMDNACASVKAKFVGTEHGKWTQWFCVRYKQIAIPFVQMYHQLSTYALLYLGYDRKFYLDVPAQKRTPANSNITGTENILNLITHPQLRYSKSTALTYVNELSITNRNHAVQALLLFKRSRQLRDAYVDDENYCRVTRDLAHSTYDTTLDKLIDALTDKVHEFV